MSYYQIKLANIQKLLLASVNWGEQIPPHSYPGWEGWQGQSVSENLFFYILQFTLTTFIFPGECQSLSKSAFRCIYLYV